MSVTVLNGDCRDVMKTLPASSVQCCVTSPPYFGLRDYGVAGQIGLEASPDAFVAEMVAVFREVRRVLRDDGVLFLNLGDSYNNRTKVRTSSHQPALNGFVDDNWAERASRGGVRMSISDGDIKEKDLLGIPWMVAFALRADGWWLRSDIIWSKPNPMPESVTDRPTSAHEHVFLLTKQPRYFYDAEAVREADAGTDHPRNVVAPVNRSDGHLSDDSGIRTAEGRNGMGRNLRNVWTIATQPFSEAHFATFPPELAERCIKAGTSERGCCASCGAPWRRVTTKGEPDMAHRAASGADGSGGYNGQSTKGHDAAGVQNASDVKRRIIEGMRLKTHEWLPSCQCNAAVVPCTVLDCFAGAFTSLLVADRLQRHGIGIELNPDYCAMAEKRLHKDAGMFAEVIHA